MRKTVLALALTTAAGACSAIWGGDDSGAKLAPAVEAARHADKRFLVSYGPKRYYVDVRYIGLINESVIAIRDDGNSADREDLSVPATATLPADEPFASSAQESVMVSIAEGVRSSAKICDNGRQMALRLNGDGEARVSYRSGRGAWVVFAACPKETG